MKFSIKEFFSIGDQIRSLLRIWSHLLKKSLMENFIFCAVKFGSVIEKHPTFSMYHIKPEASLGPCQNIYKENFLRKSQLLLGASVQNVLKII